MTDVCLILEGAYPFVAGGVSTWIHQLVTSMRDLRFSILHISPYPNPRRQFKYEVPPNVLDIQDLYLHEHDLDGPLSPARLRRRAFPRIAELHEAVAGGRYDLLRELLPLVRDPEQGVRPADVFRAPEAWEALVSAYERRGERSSFLDFFWTWRAIYLPLMKVLTAPIPKARLYHTVSTGYAGLAAAVAKHARGRRVVLTEHGVYTHERLLEISQASWIHAPRRDRFQVQRELPYFKRLWIGFFEALGRITYHHADEILTLFEGNRTRQILGGAPAERTSIVPNGIDVQRFYNLGARREARPRRTLAFVGRVVSIKDVKTFIQAACLVLDALPDAEVLVLGPLDEEPEYVAECRQLVEARGLGDRILFKGKVDVHEYYPRVDVVVLTSLSEAQPYVVLEANAAGVPVVASDVGACRELVEGRAPEDRRIGPSGVVTPVADPEATAAAVLRLLTDQRLWTRMSDAGRTRALRYYDQADMVSRYLSIYERNMH